MGVNVGDLESSLTLDDNFSDVMKAAMGNMEAFLGISLRVTAEVVKFGEAMYKATDQVEGLINRVQILHERSGLAVNTLYALQQATDTLGVSATTTSHMMDLLDRQLEDGTGRAQKALDRLAISADLLRNLPVDERMNLLTHALTNVDDAGKRAAYTLDLFGRGGDQLLNLMTEDAQEFIAHLKEINSDIEDAAPLARQWKEETTLLWAEWEKVRRSVLGVIAALATPVLHEINQVTAPPKQFDPAAAPDYSIWNIIKRAAGNWSNAPGVDIDLLGPMEAVFSDKLRKTLGDKIGQALVENYKEEAQELVDADHNAAIEARANVELMNQAHRLDVKMWNDYLASHKLELDQKVQMDRAASEIGRSAGDTAVIRAREAVSVGRIQLQTNNLLVQGELALAVARARGGEQFDIEIAKTREQTTLQLATIDLQEKENAAKAAVPSTSKKVVEALMAQNAALEKLKKNLEEAEKANIRFIEQQKLLAHIGSIATDLRIIGDIFKELGLDADSAAVRVVEGLANMASAAQDATKAVFQFQSGDVFGGITSSLKSARELIAGIKSIFTTPEYKKVMGEIGAQWGTEISESLAKRIADTETKDHVSRQVAALLNLDQVIGENDSRMASSFLNQIVQLERGIADGSVPAKAGLAELDKLFSDIGKEVTQELDAWDALGATFNNSADAMAHLSVQAERAQIEMIQLARANGIMTQSMRQGVIASLHDAANQLTTMLTLLGGGPAQAGLQQYYDDLTKQIDELQKKMKEAGGGTKEQEDQLNRLKYIRWTTGSKIDEKTPMGPLSAKDAQAQAQIFAAAFWGDVATEGVTAAVEAFQPAWEALKQSILNSGIDQTLLSTILDPIDALMALIDPKFKPLLDGLNAAGKAVEDISAAGFLTQGAFEGLETTIDSVFKKLVEGGVDSTTALEAIMPQLAEIIRLHQLYGFAIDDVTQGYIDQAEKAGLAFPTDPLQKVIDLLTLIAEHMGALDGKTVNTYVVTHTSTESDDGEGKKGGGRAGGAWNEWVPPVPGGTDFTLGEGGAGEFLTVTDKPIGAMGGMHLTIVTADQRTILDTVLDATLRGEKVVHVDGLRTFR